MAADQIAIQIPKTKWKEGSAFTATAYFRNRAISASATPTSVKYRVDCLTTGVVLTDWTAIDTAANVSIAITGTDNAIQDEGNRFERKRLIVEADADLDTQHRNSIEWRVENLRGI